MTDTYSRNLTRTPAMRRGVVTLTALLGINLATLGCGGDTSASGGTTTSPTSGTSVQESPSETTSETPAEAVTATVRGGTITGSCLGVSRDGAPTVILVAGLGNPGAQLASVSYALESRTRVCWYDRPGQGSSDPVSHPQSLTTVVDDLGTFLVQAAIAPPYVLVGHSFGASEAIRYAQLHPADVAGFVAMNPVPPYHEWIRRAGKVETPEELQSMEIDFYKGGNEESIDLTDTDLTMDPIPDEMPYVVMQSEDCGGDFCERIKPVLRKATEELLGHLGAGGRFVAFPDRPHDVYSSNLDDVVAEVTKLL
jgi:pimeloyl-ACP methyl ester carboxylesterase